MSGSGYANPFSPRAVLALVLFGTLAFVAFLWMIGSGYGQGDTNDGQAHVAGKGLNGYAALAQFLEKRGYRIERLQAEKGLKQPGLLVLTPPAMAKGAEIEKAVSEHRYVGPTMVIMPKWLAGRIPPQVPGAKKGWVMLPGTIAPTWKGFHDDVSIDITPARSAGWHGMGTAGKLPDAKNVLWARGDSLVPLVVSNDDGRILAAYVADGGYYPALEQAGLLQSPEYAEDEQDDEIYPLVLVFEPDLLNNYGMASREQAQLAESLVNAAIDGNDEDRIAFDLTLNGFARSQNLMTLAFTPPFLAATLCLLLAALAIGWRAFNRFGPPRAGTRTIAFGKRALVANAAALIRRTRRFHLVGPPYADAARERLARALALPGANDPASTEAAIDRALAARAHETAPFSEAAAAMRAARRPAELLRAAQALHALERMLKR